MTPLRSLTGIFLFSLFSPFPLFSQTWITHPIAKPDAYGVFHFRKIIGFQRKPETFIIHISADPRFRFFVNGKSVAVGPARSDIGHWKYLTLEIAPFLQDGKNVLAAVIRNDGEHSAWGQMPAGTGFFVRSNTEAEAIANTDNSWKVFKNQAYELIYSTDSLTVLGEKIVGSVYPWNWETLEFNDSQWVAVRSGENNLLPLDTLALSAEKMQRNFSLIKVINTSKVENAEAFLKGKDTQIPPNTDLVILLEQNFIYNVLPCLLVSGGSDSKITLYYADSLSGENLEKNNLLGTNIKKQELKTDVFLPDGGEKRLFSINILRSFRYLTIHITATQETLTLHDFYELAF